MPADRAGAASPEVAATDDDGDVDAEVLSQVDDLGRGRFERGAVEPLPESPASASPDGLKTIRLNVGRVRVRS